MSANRMMRALQGKLWGALFFLVFAFLLCSRYSVWLGLGPRAALIPPLFEEVQKRCLRALFEPSAEFWVVLLGDLDGDRFLIDCQRSHRATAPSLTTDVWLRLACFLSLRALFEQAE